MYELSTPAQRISQYAFAVSCCKNMGYVGKSAFFAAYLLFYAFLGSFLLRKGRETAFLLHINTPVITTIIVNAC